MEYTKLWVVMLVFLVMLTSSVFAVDVSNTEFNVNYDSLRKNDDKVAINPSVTVTNSGSTTENLVFSLTSSYALTLDQTTATVAAGDSASVKISGDLPVDLNGGLNDIAQLKVTDSAGLSTHTIKANVANMIELDKIRILVNGNEEKIANEDGEQVKDLEPGDEVELRFRLENNFHEDYKEGDIEGDIKIKLDDSDFVDEIDMEESYSLSAGEKITDNDEEIIFTFDVPIDADDGTYTMQVTVEGRDDNSADYEETWDLDLKVKRNKDDLRVGNLGFTPQTLSCVRDSVFNVEVVNYGKDRQKQGVVAVEQSDLGISLQKNFDIAKGASDSNTEKFAFPIKVSSSAKAKDYEFTVSVFYDLDKLSDRKFSKLKISNCNTNVVVEDPVVPPVSNTVEDPVDTVVDNSVEDTTSGEEVKSSTIVKTVEETPYSSADIMVGAVIIAMVLMLAVIMLLVIVLLRK